MPDKIVLWDRLYEAVLDMTMITRSQLDMLLADPDPVKHVEILRSLVLGEALVDARDKTGGEHAVSR